MAPSLASCGNGSFSNLILAGGRDSSETHSVTLLTRHKLPTANSFRLELVPFCPVPAPPANQFARAPSRRHRGACVVNDLRGQRASNPQPPGRRAPYSAAKHVAIFIQPQNGGLNKIDFLRGGTRVRLSHGQKYGGEIAEHCQK